MIAIGVYTHALMNPNHNRPIDFWSNDSNPSHNWTRCDALLFRWLRNSVANSKCVTKNHMKRTQWYWLRVEKIAHVAQRTCIHTIRKRVKTVNEYPSPWSCHRKHQLRAYFHRICSNRKIAPEIRTFCVIKLNFRKRIFVNEPLHIDAIEGLLLADDLERPTIWGIHLHRRWQIHWPFQVKISHWTQNPNDHCMCASTPYTVDPTAWSNDPNCRLKRFDYAVMGSSRRCRLLWCAHDRLILACVRSLYRLPQVQRPKFAGYHHQKLSQPYFVHALTMPEEVNKKKSIILSSYDSPAITYHIEQSIHPLMTCSFDNRTIRCQLQCKQCSTAGKAEILTGRYNR